MTQYQLASRHGLAKENFPCATDPLLASPQADCLWDNSILKEYLVNINNKFLQDKEN